MTQPPTNRPSKDYTRFRELLIAQERFPLSYLHKLIGRNTEAFEQSLAAWQKRHPGAECQSSRLSEGGSHRAVTFVLKVKDADELIEILKETDQLADLVMVL
jgi:putative lipoic acid-binding regulatory protein